MCKLKTLLCVHRALWFSLLDFYCVFTGSCGSPYSILLCVHSHVVLLTQFYCVFTVMWFPHSILLCSQGQVVLLTPFYCVFTESCGSPYSVLLCVHRVIWFSLLCFTVCSQGQVVLLTLFYCVFTEDPAVVHAPLHPSGASQ